MGTSGQFCLCCAVCLFVVAPTMAEDVAVETVLTGLADPSGVAVQPGGLPAAYQVYVSDAAAGRIVRMSSGAPGTATEVITGFPTATTGNGPLDRLGPRGLLFLDDSQLVVATGGPDGVVLRTYAVPGDGHALPATRSQQQLKRDVDGGCYAMARTHPNQAVPDRLVVSFVGARGQDALLQCRVQADFLGDLSPFGGGNAPGQWRSPMAVTVSDRGYVVVGQAGALDASRDSTISFHSPADGATIVSVGTELHDVVGLAYSPSTGDLYAVDYAAAAADDGGVYRIDDVSSPGRPACKAVKVADVRRPAALAFGPDGTLYVTAVGQSGDAGKLVKVTGGL